MRGPGLRSLLLLVTTSALCVYQVWAFTLSSQYQRRGSLSSSSAAAAFHLRTVLNQNDIQPPLVVLHSSSSSSSSETVTNNDVNAEDDASSSSSSSSSSSTLQSPVRVQRVYNSYKWTNPTSGQTHNINYRVEGDPSKPPILLVHGFGANVNHFRYNFPLLTDAGYHVYAIDLLGFGASDKAKDEEYCIELWIDLLCDFMMEMDHQRRNKSSSSSTFRSSSFSGASASSSSSSQKWVVAGNSIGGLCSLGVTADERTKDMVRGCTLFNSAGGMTSFRYEKVPLVARPIVWPIFYILQNIILSPDPNGYGATFFENFKTRDNVESILKNQGVYGDITNVNEELIEILLGPSDDDGAKDVFLKVFGGPAGPTPEYFLEQIDHKPILALWGDSDPWTPLDRGMHPGNSFAQYCKDESLFELVVLEGAGHCPHDEAPEAIHAAMLPWLKKLDYDSDDGK